MQFLGVVGDVAPDDEIDYLCLFASGSCKFSTEMICAAKAKTFRQANQVSIRLRDIEPEIFCQMAASDRSNERQLLKLIDRISQHGLLEFIKPYLANVLRS